MNPHPHTPEHTRSRPHHGGPRRPLRLLARRLGLEGDQLATVAGILEDQRIEQAQAKVDRRRAAKLHAESLTGETFDASKAEAAGAQVIEAVTRVQRARAEALAALHATLAPEQRAQLGVMLRSGLLAR
jgi:Spy/CpxP family protein refolding chaperone